MNRAALGGLMRSSKFPIAASLFLVTAFCPASAQDAGGRGPGRSGEPERTRGGGGDLKGYNPNDPRSAPRLGDGKPDFSGVWTLLGGSLGRDPLPPFVPGGEEIYKPHRDPNFDDPSGFYCMPDGMPREVNDPYPLQLVHKPGQLVFLYEYDHFFRIVPTNGQSHPPDPDPTWMGNSVAKWDGNTLVIDTTALTTHEDHWFDPAGHRPSDALHLIEHMTRTNYSTITYDLTIDDPKIWTKPWTEHMRYALRTDWHIEEYVCEEDNRTALRGINGQKPHYNGNEGQRK